MAKQSKLASSIILCYRTIFISFIALILNDAFSCLIYMLSCSPTTVELLFILFSVPKTMCAILSILRKWVVNCWINGSMEKSLTPGFSGSSTETQPNTPTQSQCNSLFHGGFQFLHYFLWFPTDGPFHI